MDGVNAETRVRMEAKLNRAEGLTGLNVIVEALTADDAGRLLSESMDVAAKVLLSKGFKPNGFEHIKA